MLHAVGSSDTGRAEAFASTYGAPVAGTYADVLARDDVDAVYIGTVHTGHAPLAIAALDAGKAVLCEKPVTPTPEATASVLEAAARSGRPFLEAYKYRFGPMADALRQLVESGELGRLERLEASFGFESDPQSGRLFDPALAGGAILDVGGYPASLAVGIAAWAGLPRAGAGAVDGHGGRDGRGCRCLRRPSTSAASSRASARRSCGDARGDRLVGIARAPSRCRTSGAIPPAQPDDRRALARRCGAAGDRGGARSILSPPRPTPCRSRWPRGAGRSRRCRGRRGRDLRSRRRVLEDWRRDAGLTGSTTGAPARACPTVNGMTGNPSRDAGHGAGLLAVGETMALVAPATGERLVDATDFRVDAGGAESNVAAHVAALGHPARWFSRLGDDALGRRVAGQLSRRGVDVSTVVMDAAHRTGVYFKDPGSGVLYYRTDSAASHLSPADADALDFAGIGILHVSGITAAISALGGVVPRPRDRARSRGRCAGELRRQRSPSAVGCRHRRPSARRARAEGRPRLRGSR